MCAFACACVRAGANAWVRSRLCTRVSMAERGAVEVRARLQFCVCARIRGTKPPTWMLLVCERLLTRIFLTDFLRSTTCVAAVQLPDDSASGGGREAGDRCLCAAEYPPNG